MERGRSAAEEQLGPLLEQRFLRCHLHAQRRWELRLRPGRDDQEPIAGVAQVREAPSFRADEGITAQVVELTPECLVAGLDVADLLTEGLGLLRDRVVGIYLASDLDRKSVV